MNPDHKAPSFGLRLKTFTVFIALLLTATVALAEPVTSIYRQLRGSAPTPATVHNDIAVVQSASFSATPIDPIATNGNPYIVAFPRGSASGATVTLTCGLYYYSEDTGTYTFLGVSDVIASTLSSAGQNGVDSYYYSVDPALFDTLGATHYDLRVTGISSGSVKVIHYPGFGARRPGE